MNYLKGMSYALQIVKGKKSKTQKITKRISVSRYENHPV